MSFLRRSYYSLLARWSAIDLPLNAGRTYYLRVNPRTADNENVRAFVRYLLDSIESMNLRA